MKDGHIVRVQILPDLYDQEAIEKSHKLFSEAPEGRFDGFELWEKARVIIRHEGQKSSMSSPSPVYAR
jgi:hypothetical protein